MRQQRFEVQVRGTIAPEVLLEAGDDIRVQPVTLISGEIRDQSQLHSILRRLQGLGIDVLSMTTREVPDRAD